MSTVTRPAPGVGAAPAAERAARLRRVARDPIVIAGAVTVALVVVGELVSPGFAGWGQIVNMLRVASFLGVVAAGQTIVILSGGGGIDLSVGKVATFAAIVGSRIMQGDDAGVVAGVVVPLAACALIGLGNGLGVTLLRIPPFVMTLGMTGVVYGLIMVYTNGRADGRAAPALTTLVNGELVLGLPGVLFLWAAIAVLVTWLLRRTTFGWRLFAVGANPEAAELSGVPVRRTVILAYVAGSVFAGLGGLLLVGYTESVMLNLADDYTMPAIAAVIIGGTLAAGGVGGYLGTAVGAVTLTVLTSLLTTLDIGSAWRTVVNGVVLVALLSFYGRQKRLRA
jgi:ribose transport system permease protein